MARRLGIAFASALGAYAGGAVLGAVLVAALSANVRDRSVEAVMTGAFVTGPVAAIVGFAVGLARGGRAR